MVYSLAQIKTVADCDLLLGIANMEKKDILLRKLQQEKQHDTVTSTGEGVSAELQGVEGEISGYATVVSNLPDGPIKKEFESKLKKAEHKKFLLEERKEKYGILALLQKEYTLACIANEDVENQAYIDAITQHKAVLPA